MTRANSTRRRWTKGGDVFDRSTISVAKSRHVVQHGIRLRRGRLRVPNSTDGAVNLKRGFRFALVPSQINAPGEVRGRLTDCYPLIFRKRETKGVSRRIGSTLMPSEVVGVINLDSCDSSFGEYFSMPRKS